MDHRICIRVNKANDSISERVFINFTMNYLAETLQTVV